jgi:hypothetical protein
MKYCLLFILLCASASAHSQPNKYEMGLSAATELFYRMQSKEDHELAFNKFEVLSNAHPHEWLPPYYASIVKARMSILNLGDRDRIADEALGWVARAKKLQINDEILCAESLANSAKMSISPMRRWLSYESRIQHPLKAAKKINPNNPRIYVLESSILHHLPGLFGGGCKGALPIAKKAEKLLEEQGSNRGNLPRWGIKSIKDILKNCAY